LHAVLNALAQFSWFKTCVNLLTILVPEQRCGQLLAISSMDWLQLNLMRPPKALQPLPLASQACQNVLELVDLADVSFDFGKLHYLIEAILDHAQQPRRLPSLLCLAVQGEN